MARAFLPLKDLVAAKTRLAGVLTPSERRAFMQAMAEDVLSILSQHPDISGVTLVSDDPGAPLLAEHFGAQHLSERALGCAGLNAALAAACRQHRFGPAEQALVLHADLPWLSSLDIQGALEQQRVHGGVVIAPDRAAIGTNLLAFDAAGVPPFRFGAESCEAHRSAARALGLGVSLLVRDGLSRDVDQPQDIAELLAQPGCGAATREWLAIPGLRERLGVTLASTDLQGITEPVPDERDREKSISND